MPVASTLRESAPVYTNGIWLLLQLVSVAQKNRPSTILSSNIYPSTSGGLHGLAVLNDVTIDWLFNTL